MVCQLALASHSGGALCLTTGAGHHSQWLQPRGAAGSPGPDLPSWEWENQIWEVVGWEPR